MKKGFTLIEAVIVIFILGIVVAGLIPILSKGIEAFSYGMNAQEDLAKARIAMERMVSEIREAECICIHNDSGYGIVWANPLTGGRFSFNQSGTEIKKNVINTVTPVACGNPLCTNRSYLTQNTLINSIKSGSFSVLAYDINGNLLASWLPANPVRVKLKFSIQTKPGGELPFETQVVLRKRVQ